jgi:hypothetical protein
MIACRRPAQSKLISVTTAVQSETKKYIVTFTNGTAIIAVAIIITNIIIGEDANAIAGTVQ